MASDEQLLTAWADGSTDAGDRFIRRYFDLLWRYFRNKADSETEDLVQNTLAACVRYRERLKDVRDVRAYVLTIARNELIAHARRVARQPLDIFDPAQTSIHDLNPSPSTVVAQRREQQHLLNALRRLPIEQQELLELYYWEGLRTSELAAVYGVPEPTVRRRLQRARGKLREMLDTLQVAEDAALDALARSVASSLGDADVRGRKPED